MKKKIGYLLIGFIFVLNRITGLLSREEHIRYTNKWRRMVGATSFCNEEYKDEGYDALILTIGRFIAFVVLIPIWPILVAKDSLDELYNKITED